MNVAQVIMMLAAACEEAGGQKAWAQAHKMSEAFVSDTLHGRRDPSHKILKALHLERIVTYRRIIK